jgi:hypothetical protein
VVYRSDARLLVLRPADRLPLKPRLRAATVKERLSILTWSRRATTSAPAGHQKEWSAEIEPELPGRPASASALVSNL